MTVREFTTYEEIDRELEIKKLEMQINKHKLLNDYDDFKQSMVPTNLALNLGVKVAQNFLLGKILRRILPILK